MPSKLKALLTMATYATPADRRWAAYQLGISLLASIGGTLAVLYVLTILGTLIGLPHDPMPRWTFAGGVAGILAMAWSTIIGRELRRLRDGMEADPAAARRRRRRARIIKALFFFSYLLLPIDWGWYWRLVIAVGAAFTPFFYRTIVALCGRRNYRAASGLQEPAH